MSTYMVLYSYTTECLKNPAQIPAGIEQVHATISQMGGKVIACYALMGEYDSVGIYELPNDQAAMALLLGIASSGLVRTKTLKAFSPTEFASFVRR